MYINTETKEYPVSELDIRQLFPNTSFPTPLVSFAPYELVYGTVEPKYDLNTQDIVQVSPVFNIVRNRWEQQWEIVDKTPEQIQILESAKKEENRQMAMQLLSETDWTVMPDVSDQSLSDPYLFNATEFISYRSKLRKIAVNPTIDVDWPVKPQEVWR